MVTYAPNPRYAAEWLGPYCDAHGDPCGAAWCAFFLMAVDAQAEPPAAPAAGYTFATPAVRS